MRSALGTLLEAIPSSLPILWLSTLTTVETQLVDFQYGPNQPVNLQFEDQWLVSIIRRLSGTKNCSSDVHKIIFTAGEPSVLLLKPTTIVARNEVFQDYFRALISLPSTLYAARKQIIIAKMKFQKPSKKLEIMDLGSESLNYKQAPKGSERNLRNGSDREKSNHKDENNLQQHRPTQISNPLPMTEEGDKQCVRELRNFLRATLGELHKEKKCLVFWRPVDPESVPDYYDVVLSPMDLETMRMKVKITISTIKHLLSYLSVSLALSLSLSH